MFQPLEFFVGLRYTRAKRRNHFISFISLSSMLGIALGVTALIVVLSVMNGFEREITKRILGVVSHLTVQGDALEVSNWQALAGRVREQPHVVGVAPYVEEQAMLTQGPLVRGALVRGVLPGEETRVSEVANYLRQGALTELVPGRFNIVLGREIANALGVRLGDKVTVVAPTANVTPVGILPRLKRFTVAGVFEVGHNEYDSGLALVHQADAARLFRLGRGLTGVRVKLDSVFDAPDVKKLLVGQLGSDYEIRDWTDYHANFFRAIKLEKTVMFIILALIVAVAAFNIVATLVMVVTDKQADIAVLRTLGSSPRSIMAVFMVQGMVIGLFGTLLGDIGGISLATSIETLVPRIEEWLNIEILPSSVYYISSVPSEMRWPDVVAITVVAFVMSIVATIYPAWRASRTEPAAALRYE